MKIRSYIVIFCLLASVTFLASCVSEKTPKKKSETTSQETTPQAQGRSKAPAFQGKNLVDGSDISLEALKGHVLIIDFWATWCPPCRQEIPGFIELVSAYKDKKFAVIGMSVDRGGEAVKRFIEEYKINYPVIMATRQIQSDYEEAMGKPIRGIPTTLVVDKEGNIVSVYVGYRPKDVFEKEIQKLLL